MRDIISIILILSVTITGCTPSSTLINPNSNNDFQILVEELDGKEIFVRLNNDTEIKTKQFEFKKDSLILMSAEAEHVIALHQIDQIYAKPNVIVVPLIGITMFSTGIFSMAIKNQSLLFINGPLIGLGIMTLFIGDSIESEIYNFSTSEH